MSDSSQTRLLRIAAFLVDTFTAAILLILPASAVSYAMTWAGIPRAIQLVWWAALAILMLLILLRDGFRGRSLGKHLLGLRLLTPRGKPCGLFRSTVRNLPLLIPGWNILELLLVLGGRRRTGDYIAKTTVAEE
jgi:uncharacterized RDD family membrane protein YckC